MKRATQLFLATIVLALIVGPWGQAGSAPDPAPVPQLSFIQTTTNDWQTGTWDQVDIRNLDALHTPYGLGNDPRGAVRLTSVPDTWTRQSVQEPAVPRGEAGAWDEEHTAEAAVIHNGNQYMMWYSGQNAADQWQIGLATSTSGLTWTKHVANPVLTVGEPGAWDDTEVSFATVLYDGQTYSTWYSGYDGTYRQIGYAWSNDGLAWARHPNPVLSYGADDAWDNILVGNPTVLFDGAIYHMWYGGWQSPEGIWRIGHATSTNGLDWTKDPANPVLEPGPDGSWDDYHVKAPSVLFDGQTFKLWYGGWNGPDDDPESYGRIGQATSDDGTTWFRDPDNPVFNPAGGVWDPQWATDPEVIFDGDLYHLWYTGGVTWTGLQIGYATALPLYVETGVYNSPLISVSCGPQELLRWQGLLVEQALNGQEIWYSVLDEVGRPITGFYAMQSPEDRALFDLGELGSEYDRVYLQAILITGDSTQSPVLEAWELFWGCKALPYQLFLPVVILSPAD